MSIAEIESLLGPKAQDLLTHVCKTVSKDMLHVPRLAAPAKERDGAFGYWW